MIYQTITDEFQNYLGSDYDIRYANNHDLDWENILPENQDEIKFGILQVDSGTTSQVGGQVIRIEQMRLKVAIPESREVFTEAVANLRTMMEALNNSTSIDSEENITARLYFSEYHDATSSIINGSRWWVAEVTFIANFYNSIIESNDVSVTIGGQTVNGLINARFVNEKTFDPNVFSNSNGIVKASVNGIKKTLQLDVVYIKSDALITSLLNNEDSLTATWSIVYNNAIKSRTLTMTLASITENVIIGDVLKAQITFTIGA